MQKCCKDVRFEVLVAVIMKITVIWDVMLCSLVMYTDHTASHPKTVIFMLEIKHTLKILYDSYHVVKFYQENSSSKFHTLQALCYKPEGRAFESR
jgi:hypothetical protein